MLCILLLRFPNVRLLWSRSHLHTASLFAKLMAGSKHPVELDRVETMGTADDRTYDAGATAESDDSRENRDTAISMLHAVPGINKNNVYEVMARVDSLAALARMSVEELRPLLGLENARMCFDFFNTKT